MGQYHKVYNLDKCESLHAHKIGNGLKLLEQCGPDFPCPTTSDAVWLLLANSNGRGGGDAPHHSFIGRWAGDRLLVQGDYAREGDQGYVTKAALDAYTDISEPVHEMLRFVFYGEIPEEDGQRVPTNKEG